MVRNDIMDEGLGAQRVLFLVVMLSVAFARLPFFDNGPDASPPTQTTCDAFAAYAGPRIVAVGDVHGDYNALREVLAAAGLVGDASESCEWTGEDATLIQIGDVADRGPDVARANECLRALQAAAPADGGRVVRLVGNHELIRAEGSFRDAHPREAARIASVRIWRSEVEAGAVQAGFAVGPFLFTHSGFRPSMLRRLQRRTPDELAAHVNDRLTRALQTCVETAGTASCSFRDDVFSAGPDRGGRGVGGTFWTDWGVLSSAPQVDLPDAMMQIVGHTAARCSPRSGRCEPIRFRPDLRAAVVDAGLSRAYGSNRAYLEIDKGRVSSRWLRPGSATRRPGWTHRNLTDACTGRGLEGPKFSSR